LVKAYEQLVTEYPKLIEYIETVKNLVYPKEEEYIFEFINNGHVISKITRDDFFKEDADADGDGDADVVTNTNNDKRNSYSIYKQALASDFYIYTDYSTDASGKNKLIKKSYEQNKEKQFVLVASSVKFILCEITIGIDSDEEKTIKFSFSNDKYNYLVNGNVLDKNFMRYFMNKYHFNEIYRNDYYLLQNYKIKLIDDNVTIHIFDSSKQINIFENSYTITEYESQPTREKADDDKNDEEYENKINETLQQKTLWNWMLYWELNNQNQIKNHSLNKLNSEEEKDEFELIDDNTHEKQE
jgi:hypothetical protein